MKPAIFDIRRWTEAERVLACSLATLPFAVGWVARLYAIANDPSASPYVSRSFLAVNLPVLWWQAIGHALLVVAALVARARGATRSPWLVIAEVQHWTSCAAFSLYAVGPFTTSFSILLLALPVLGYLLFDRRIMHGGLVTLGVGSGLGMLLPQLGVVPYAPFFERSPMEHGRLSAQYIAAFGVPSVFVAIVVVAVHASLVEKLRQRTLELERMSRTDALTGLANRRVFFARLEEEAARATRHGHALSALMIDVDFFKAVNDTLGHVEGDRVLCAIADAIRDALRTGDVPARYGGEEFAVILPETSLEDAAVVADRLRAVVSAVSYGSGAQRRSMSISVGIAALTDGETTDSLVARADAALYESEHAGRDRATLASVPEPV